MSATVLPRCALCGRETALPAMRQQRRGFPLCSRCHGRPARVRTAREERLGSKTFYVDPLAPRAGGLSAGFYTVKLVGRRLTCTCPDFTHRGQVLRQPCKHCRLVRIVARAAGGIRRVPAGVDLRFTLSDPASVVRRRL